MLLLSLVRVKLSSAAILLSKDFFQINNVLNAFLF